MPNLVQELNGLDFSVYIGGPLQAAVSAQHAASMSQVDFIKEVGFIQEGSGSTAVNKLRYVDFTYKKVAPNPAFDPTKAVSATNSPTQEVNVAISVPFLSMLTIPALRIDEVTIDFNAKLTSAETSNASSEFAGSAEISARVWRVNFKASASYKRTTSSTSTTERTYNLNVHVRAVNDEMPAGLERIFNILEDSMRHTEVPAPASGG
jgi:hypothetical protein